MDVKIPVQPHWATSERMGSLMLRMKAVGFKLSDDYVQSFNDLSEYYTFNDLSECCK